MTAENPTGGRGDRPSPLIVYPLIFLSFVVFMLVLRELKSILIPFALAVFLAYILYPLVAGLNRLRIPYFLAVILVVVFCLGLVLAFGLLVGGEIGSFINAIPQYQQTLRVHIARLLDAYAGLVDRLAAALPGDPAVVPSTPSPGNAPAILSGIIQNLFSSLLTVFSVLSDTVMVFFILVFLLAGARDFKKIIITAWGPENEERAAGIVEAINRNIGGYIIVRTLINLALAILATGVLLIFRIDYAYIWGPLIGLLNFIPYIGAFVGLLGPLGVALFSYESYWTALALLAVLLVIQNLEGNIISPYLIGRKTRLNPLTVLMTLILWGFIWGPVGMILATPLTSCVKILCDQIEPLRPVGRLLGGAVKKQ
ncbi:MAG: AI-2E family transporter [Candidatus Erginobacter occultus]|nr:AI-2E family transporter [Candidatus Erginobacter occultus]